MKKSRILIVGLIILLLGSGLGMISCERQRQRGCPEQCGRRELSIWNICENENCARARALLRGEGGRQCNC